MVMCLHFNKTKPDRKVELFLSSSCPTIFIAVSLLLNKISYVLAKHHNKEAISWARHNNLDC